MPYKLRKTNDGRFLFTALLGVSIVAVIQIVGRSEVDRSLFVSLYAFAVAVPFLGVFIWTGDLFVTNKPSLDRWYYNFVGVAGSLASLIGIGAIFWHFSRTIGVIFILCSLFGFCVLIAFSKAIDA
jgi:hypothetical protein